LSLENFIIQQLILIMMIKIMLIIGILPAFSLKTFEARYLSLVVL
jgi:hypothetical protein